MNRRRMFIILAVLSVLGGFSAGAQDAACPADDYRTFLYSKGLCGPVGLMFQSATATGGGRFDLAYLLTGACEDVVQVNIVLYSVSVSGASPGVSLTPVRSITQVPPFDESIPILYPNLRFGRIYAFRVSVVTAMAALALEDPEQPDQEVTVQSQYFCWPQSAGFVSVGNRFEGARKEPRFVVRWQGGANAMSHFLRFIYQDGSQTDLLGPWTGEEATLSALEAQAWGGTSIAAIAKASQAANGPITVDATIPFSAASLAQCNPIPCDMLSLLDYVLLDNRLHQAKISTTYGGAFSAIKYKYATGSMSPNLITATDSGVLCQNDTTRVGTNWTEIEQTEISANREDWEDYDPPPSPYAPECTKDRDNAKFHWNPTQGGGQPDCPVDNNTDNNSDWGASTTLGNGASVLETTPYHVIAGNNSSPVVYTSKFKHWLSLDAIPSDFKPQAQTWVEARIAGLYGTCTSSGALKCETRFLLSKWSGPTRLSDAMNTILEDWVFFGSAEIQKSYMYDPNYSQDACFHMKPLSACTGYPYQKCLCTYGDNTCLHYQGWRKLMEQNPGTYGTWVPYTMVSNTAQTLFVVLYNTNEGQYNQIRRILRSQPDPNIPGHVISPRTRFEKDTSPYTIRGAGLSTETWSNWLTTYIIVGDSEQSVMCRLKEVSGGTYPIQTPPNCASCPGAPPCE